MEVFGTVVHVVQGTEACKVSKKYGKMVSMHGRCAADTVMALFYMFR